MYHVRMNKTVRIALLTLLLALPAAGANWTNYADDFSTDKVESDSYLHSTFYESQINPLPEPYLQYHVGETTRGLVFMDYQDQPAELGYCLSVDAAHSRRMISGTLSLDVSFPCDADVAQAPPGELFYAVSPDGMTWSEKQPLWAGHHAIPVRSTEGTCYVLLSGARAKIDNVRTSLSTLVATIRVPTNYGTIQQAIDAARDGDIIDVAPGTYTESGNWDIDFRGKQITLRSTSGPQSTIILCRDGHRGFHFDQGETSESVLSGFTIRGGRLSGSTTMGGGIYCGTAGPTILNCVIEDCVAAFGGGIACVGGEPVVSGCTIKDCSASSAGAGIYLLESTATIAGCTISDNIASGSARGGGAYCAGDPLDATFRNCVVSGNSAAGGAGILVERFTAGGWQCRVSIVNCTVVRNRLTSAGSAGGVDAGDGDVTILNTIVWGNDEAGVTPSYTASVSYSNIQGGYLGQGNINADPLFADSEYHLGFQSPCIDAGDPSSSFAGEPAPNGGRINMGAYGGTIGATQGAERTIYHVNVQTGRDWNDGRSHTRPFGTIQAGINAAGDGDTVLVWPGTYREQIAFQGKAITVRSAADAAVITAPDGYACTFQRAESSDSILANFVITGCGISGIFCNGASPTLKNLTIVKNQGGVVAYGGAEPVIVNCIIWSNINTQNKRNASLSAWGPAYAWKASYSCIDAASTDKFDSTMGNINTDPLFANFAGGDFHLRSRYGRYVSASDTWVFTDNGMSPCIDAGDPWDDPRNEPQGNGNLINMGAYGGTRTASRSGLSPCP